MRRKNLRTPEERARQRQQNRKLWHLNHEVELNETKALLFKALRLLRQSKIELTAEMASVLSQHESRVAARVERTRAMRKKFEVTTS